MLYKNGGEILSFYDTFELLCQKKGVTPTGAARDNDISQSVVGMWKKRGSVPKYETLKKLADYFGVDVDDLVTVKEHAEAIKGHVKEKLKDAGPLRKMTYAEQYRAGFIKFKSDGDRTTFFYNRLNDAGKIAAGGCFFQHINPDEMKEVADYVLNLSENPLYKVQEAPQSHDTTHPKVPQRGRRRANRVG